MNPPQIPGICERDIDLLLLEELSVTPEFASRLISYASGERPVQVTSVRQSVTQSSGESDLEIAWRRAQGGEGRVLIENKVDASFQRNQAARYRQRAEAYIRNGACDCAWTLVVAPAAYFSSEDEKHGFDASLTYEQVQQWYEEAGLGARGVYKIRVLAAAIAKSRLGYNPIADDAISRFWHDYWELSLAEAPELGMGEPGPKPPQSTWIYFAPGGLPRAVWLLHKVTGGSVELSLGGRGGRLGEVRVGLLPLLEPDMQVERTGKSTAVRLRVEPMNMTVALHEQVALARAAMAAAGRLRRWAYTHRDALESI